MSDSLKQLHDFYQPPPPSWMPHTVGWYVVFAVLGLLALWLVIRSARHWMANRYRREALRQLPHTPAEQLSALLKRTALSAWQRETVASLSGETWIKFLAETSKETGFARFPGNSIELIALRPTKLSEEEELQLRNVSASWIRSHRVQA